MKTLTFLGAVLCGACMLAVGVPAQAQGHHGSIATYGSIATSRFGATSPNSHGLFPVWDCAQWYRDYGDGSCLGYNPLFFDGHPGAKLYMKGANAYRKHDYAHAIHMWKKAASRASNQARYSLGLMYFRGDGVVADRPLGTAWMRLAAGHNKALVKVHDAMVAMLTPTQHARAETLWHELQQYYAR